MAQLHAQERRRLQEKWFRRSAKVSFREPIHRFLDVAALGVIGGVTLLFVGAPGGLLYAAVVTLWSAGTRDAVTVAGALAQVSLTVWVLVVSIGGATYIEAARTIRTDSRDRTRALHSGRDYLRKGDPPRFKTMPGDLVGALREIALDTPPLDPQELTADEALPALARRFEVVLDYWNRRSGYESALNSTWTSADVRRIRGRLRRMILWRTVAAASAFLAAACYVYFGAANLMAPGLLLAALCAVYRGRLQLLDR